MEEFDEIEVKDKRALKRAIKLKKTGLSTHVFAIAISPNSIENSLLSIPVIVGEPIGNLIYDHIKDCCYVEGCCYFEIGTVPVSYCLTIDGTDWKSNSPLPISVIRRYMRENQKRRFDNWKSGYQKGYDIKYVQLVSVF